MMKDDREGGVDGDVSDDNDGDGSEDDDEAECSVNCSPFAAVCVCVGSNAIKQSISDQPFTLIPTHYL